MRHSSVLLSAQSASNLKKNDQPLLALTRAATLKTTTPANARLMRGIATAAILPGGHWLIDRTYELSLKASRHADGGNP